MNERAYDNMVICPQCGAGSFTPASQCWMCFAGLINPPDIVMAEVVEGAAAAEPSWAPSEWFFANSTAVLGVVLVVVGIGLASQGWGAAIAYALIIGPAFLATAIRTKVRQGHGHEVSLIERLATFLISGTIMVGVVTLVSLLIIVAIIVSLVIACFQQIL